MSEQKLSRKEFLENLTEEYKAKTQVIKSALSAAGISEHNFSASSQAQVRDMAEIAVALDIKDDSDTSFLLSILKQKTDQLDLTIETDALKYKVDNLKRKLVALSNTITELQKETILEAQAETAQAKLNIEELSSDLKTMSKRKTKLSDELQQIEKEPALPQDCPTHADILNLVQVLNAKQLEIRRLEVQLAVFHRLPFNLVEAQRKLDDTKKELEVFEAEMVNKTPFL